MPRAYLVAENAPGGSREVPIGRTLVLGRAAECGCIVDDAAASRRHIQIDRREDGGYVWKDLGSTNGTLLNGAKMLQGLLKKGDCIQIGESIFRFELDGPPADTAAAPPKRPESTLFKQTIIGADGQFTTGRAVDEGGGHLLLTLYEVINAIASEYETGPLMDTVLERTATALKAYRCAILIGDSPDAPLRPCPGHESIHIYENNAIKKVAASAIPLSSTVVKRVLREGESVLYQDSGADAELNAAQSIVAMELRSIICVPLRGKNGVFGILYVDTNRPGHAYSQEDLLLGTAIGNSAGLALENALLQQEMLEKQRFEQELELAWTIQEGFLFRDWPETAERFEVYGETRPAKTVGGDFYDFMQLGPDRVAILIGDVSGKGMPASLTMARLLAEFRVSALTTDDPAEVLAQINEGMVKHSQRGIFCTIAYIQIDLTTGHMRCANAGHHPAVLVSPGGARFFGEASGPPVGVVSWVTWDVVEGTLAPNESVLLYTDGIAEARAAFQGTDTPPPGTPPIEYGIERLMAFALRNASSAPRELIDAINRDVAAFCGPVPPHDDCTMIALRYLA